VASDFERLKAALAGRYDLERELGQGGMATVYLARDPKHDRHVAVKVLHPELAASMGADRFLREIQITAKLSHPHILPLYDSGEADGFLYYVMPFVPGESLSDRIAREKQLSIEEAVQITREVAEGLAYAHSYGLVHRDIKPDNIMLSGGHAVIADFGIARAVNEAGGEKMTQTGMSVGTPAYMSPEQGMGDPNIDGRSDIYSLGCVLYELLVGQIPFTGPTPQAIIARHSMDHVPAPHIMRDSVPPELEDIIYCALAKVPADRFRTAQELVDALTAVAAGATPRVRKSTAARRPAEAYRIPVTPWKRAALPALGVLVLVAAGLAGWRLFGGRSASPAVPVGSLDPTHVAVLYFQDLSARHDLGYVADGLTDGLIDQLSRVPNLTVISENGVAPYRDTKLTRDSVARALQVGTVFIGSVEPEGGDRLRVTTRLIDGESGAEVQSATFVLPTAQLTALQDSASSQIAAILRQRLGAEIKLREERAGTDNVNAWVLFLRAEAMRKDAEARLEDENVTGAFTAFDQADSVAGLAEQTDAKWAQPAVLQGQIAYRRARLSDEQPEMVAHIQDAVRHAEHALALSPRDPEALELLGTVRYFWWTRQIIPDPGQAAALLDSAKADLEESVRLDPYRAGAYSTLSSLYYQTDAISDALIAAEKAYRQDAYLRVANDVLWRLFLGSYDLAQFTQAQRWCDEGARRFPGYYRFTECQLWLMTTPAVAPDVAQGWSLLARVDSLTPEPLRASVHHRAMMVVGGIIARASRQDSADAARARALADSARHVLVAARAGPEIDPVQELLSLEAFMRTLLGDQDTAIDLLKRYVTANHPFTVGGDVHWWWRDLVRNPRFREVETAR
jgi:TolB-like protein/tRNA A-37 threonylcarbamoyl transferase component Bud32